MRPLLLALLLCSAAATTAQTPGEAPPRDPSSFLEPVEQAPELIGGLEGLQRRVEYPMRARRAGVEGTVFVQFLVDERGMVADATCVRSPNELLCDAALQAVRESRFIPGMQEGRPVKVLFTLPVAFKLEGPEPDPTPAQFLPMLLGQPWDPEIYQEIGHPASGAVQQGAGALVFTDPEPTIDQLVLYVEDGIARALEAFYLGSDATDNLRQFLQDLEAEAGAPDAEGFFGPHQLGEARRLRIEPDANRMRLEYAPYEPEVENTEGGEALGALPDVDESGVYNTAVDVNPVLIGGLEGLRSRLVYPPEAQQAGIEGRVFVQFVVDESGAVMGAFCARSPNTDLCDAALAAVEASRFEPGIQDGQPVKVRFTLPVDFQLR